MYVCMRRRGCCALFCVVDREVGVSISLLVQNLRTFYVLTYSRAPTTSDVRANNVNRESINQWIEDGSLEARFLLEVASSLESSFLY